MFFKNYLCSIDLGSVFQTFISSLILSFTIMDLFCEVYTKISLHLHQYIGAYKPFALSVCLFAYKIPYKHFFLR